MGRKDDPLVSILYISREDTALVFRDTLKSVLDQTYGKKEIIVVNGNPVDSPYTHGLTEDLAGHGDIALVHSGRTSLEYLKGEYVAFIAGGDIWHPDKLSLQVEALEGGGACVCCVNGIIEYEKNRYTVGEEIFNDDSRKMVERSSQVMYRKDIIDKYGGFDGRLDILADLDFLLRIGDECPVIYLPEVLFTGIGWKDKGDLAGYFDDLRLIMEKHGQVFLKNPRQSSDYCIINAKRAFHGGLGVYAIRLIILALYYAPIYSLKRGINSLLKFMYGTCKYWLRWAGAVYGGWNILRNKNDGRKFSLDGEPETLVVDDLDLLPPFNFAGNGKLTRVKISPGARVIKRGMFYNCGALTDVMVPATVIHIESRAFQGCKNLTNVVFQKGSSLESMGDYAFAGCTAMGNIRIPKNLKTLGRAAFAGCKSLETTGDFPNTLRIFPAHVFKNCTGLKESIFKGGSVLNRIGRGAFYNCWNLQRVLFTGRIGKIGGRAFYGCRSLMDFGMPYIDEVTSTGRYAFYKCLSLKEIIVPHLLKKINPYTYYGCEGVEVIVVPPGVRSIKKMAFARCASLKEIILMGELTKYVSSSIPENTVITRYGEDE